MKLTGVDRKITAEKECDGINKLLDKKRRIIYSCE